MYFWISVDFTVLASSNRAPTRLASPSMLYVPRKLVLAVLIGLNW